jgi:hypothetical protein
MSNWEINKELSELNKDKKIFKEELEKHKNQMAHLLLNEMGKDIDDVINGNVKIKLSFKEKIKYKLKYFLDKIFSVI